MTDSHKKNLSRNEAILCGQVTTRGTLTTLPPNVGSFAVVKIKVEEQEFTIEGRNGHAERLAEFWEGDTIEAEGRLRQDQWETKDGSRSRVVLEASDVRLIQPRERKK